MYVKRGKDLGALEELNGGRWAGTQWAREEPGGQTELRRQSRPCRALQVAVQTLAMMRAVGSH